MAVFFTQKLLDVRLLLNFENDVEVYGPKLKCNGHTPRFMINDALLKFFTGPGDNPIKSKFHIKKTKFAHTPLPLVSILSLDNYKLFD